MTSHDKGPMSPKPSFRPEEPDSRILRGYYGAKEFDDPGPFYTRPKARAEEEKMFEGIQRKPKWPRDVAQDDPALGTLDPRRKERHAINGSFPERPQKKGRVQ